MISPKNALQQFLQASRRPFPRYETREVSHQQFLSIIHLDDDGSQYGDPESRLFSSKKAAESHIADITIKKLKNKQPVVQNINPTCTRELQRVIQELLSDEDASIKPTSALVLIDGDNFEIDPALISACPEAKFIIFMSRNCPRKISEQNALENCQVRYAPIVGKDACDIYMSYEARGYRDQFPGIDLAIVTRDHFGQTLAECANGRYVCNESELEEFLHQRSRIQVPLT